MEVLREIVLDTETTGLNIHEGDKIIEIGCVELINRVRTGRVLHKYLNPERHVSSEAFHVHGLSNEFLADKPLFKDTAQEFLDFIEDSTLVIHNASFDIGFINYELKSINLEQISMVRVIDTLRLARTKFPKLPASLDALCKRYNINSSSRVKHSALIDSELLAQVYVALLEGTQSMFDFFGKSTKQDAQQITRRELPKRTFPLTADEESSHNELVSKIPGALWNN
ncbi:DNA polymerase III subunit epsilon [Rickettsiales endosymbiont of Peranema trichophorum]|uniref:DNA polymerase III subunit epsilon n=1 Tax=Rickettsiales endosymbiont of Peranema trichophorum TaxID=2486577 RepID=UPI001022D271|nr:DNA polymerase III subunit epsilon [Rickettsiales endosymbiont of Peranema trichophorum]RZI46975.1 DNA polymerase III subunit epsilon [Rickettsiales endosymbiont of Peranema trichophorum]